MRKNLMSVQELQEKQQDVVILDASWHMPALQRDAKVEYMKGHIPGARFFDIDALSDASSDLPHMLSTAEAWAKGMSELGIQPDDEVVVYDSVGLFSAARAWWMFRQFGHDKVWVLDGGLPAWEAAHLPIANGAESWKPTQYPVPIPTRLVVSREEVERQMHESVILDARAPGRFKGEEKEPREGLRSGHIPGSRNLHYKAVLEDGGYVKPEEELQSLLQAEGVTQDKPVITSCGSGVTAAILALALDEAGHKNWKLYDGSWAEWGQEKLGMPVAIG